MSESITEEERAHDEVDNADMFVGEEVQGELDLDFDSFEEEDEDE